LLDEDNDNTTITTTTTTTTTSTTKLLPQPPPQPIIQFNSILYYLCAESTAVRPITDTAQFTNK
jgi:hypothetical protein